jgi:hypothetical protein
VKKNWIPVEYLILLVRKKNRMNQKEQHWQRGLRCVLEVVVQLVWMIFWQSERYLVLNTEIQAKIDISDRFSRRETQKITKKVLKE